MHSSAACSIPPARPNLSCPRCDSTNTKFCYFNNYNFSQPRHFCKCCRRYWTHGGTLRDVPVGGATRKPAKRCRVTASSSLLPPFPVADRCSFGGVLPLMGYSGICSGMGEWGGGDDGFCWFDSVSGLARITASSFGFNSLQQ